MGENGLEHFTLGIYEKALPEAISWEERLQAAREAGYDFVELSIDESDRRIGRLQWNNRQKRDLRQAVERTGTRIQSLSLSAHRRFPLGSPTARVREHALDLFLKAIDFAADLGIRLILVCGADNYYGESTPETRSRYIENLEKGLRKASGAGVMLGLENWDIQVNSLAKAMTYIDHFNSPWFQLYADLGNLVYAGFDVLAELELARGHIAALHVKDTLPGNLRSVPLGQGAVPFRSAFEHLASREFNFPTVIELWTGEEPQALAAAAQANRFVRDTMAQARKKTYPDQTLTEEQNS